MLQACACGLWHLLIQIQCVVEDNKVGTHLLEEKITKVEKHVKNLNIAAFNKI